jgi:fermentation-respiration switch protein FrsA (DUF1100 family)
MGKIFIYILGAIFVIFFYVKFMEKKGIYFPYFEIEQTPQDLGLKYQDIYIKTPDGFILNGWFIPAEDSKYTIIFFHGNAGNISHRLDKISIFHKLGLNTFIFDYRGYGKSKGKPDEKGFYIDAEAVYKYLLNELKILENKIILYGESLGTAIAIKLASEQKVKAIILEGAFSRGKDMAKRIYPFLPYFFFSNSFDSLSRIKKIEFPKLFLHSQDDEIVPFSLAKKLYDSAPDPKDLIKLNGSHNGCFLESKELYISALDKFIKELK